MVVFMVYGSIYDHIYGYLRSYLWSDDRIYGRMEPNLWVWKAVLVFREVYTGEEDRKYIFRRRNIYQKHSSILSSLSTLFEGKDTFSLPPPLPLYNLTRVSSIYIYRIKGRIKSFLMDKSYYLEYINLFKLRIIYIRRE